MHINGIMIAAPSSGTGKTTVSIGIMKALRDRGLEIQPFKVGPDYIDPGFHRHASGNMSYNLDTVMGSKATVREIYCRNSTGKNISIVEGVMGLFDGKSGNTIKGSSFEISLILGLPVIMVVDISSSGRSVAALVNGFKNFDKRLHLKGVILNRAGSGYHCEMVKEAIERTSGIKVLGCIKRNEDMKLDSRYLGLVPLAENRVADYYFETLSKIIEESVDLDAIVKIASTSSFKDAGKNNIYNYKRKEKARIGVANNRAFTFYYKENIELLEKYGGNIVYFDPIEDRHLPDVDGIYIGGGYPEIYAGELSRNTNIMNEIKKRIENNMPVFAECGGYMYLSESMLVDGVEYPMVGSIPGKIHMESLALGYRKIEACSSNPLLRMGEKIRGHEFHYSRISFPGEHTCAYKFPRGKPEGYVRGNLTAGYAHLYFPSNQNFPRRFVALCSEYKKKKIS
jgi:cobyrinic acid a,c-diamide synthase